jgi:hypothetical protein
MFQDTLGPESRGGFSVGVLIRISPEEAEQVDEEVEGPDGEDPGPQSQAEAAGVVRRNHHLPASGAPRPASCSSPVYRNERIT